MDGPTRTGQGSNRTARQLGGAGVSEDDLIAALVAGHPGAFDPLSAYGDPGLLVNVSYLSAPLNLAVPNNAVQLLPSIPGYYALRAGFQAVMTVAAGTLVGAASCKVGNNVARDNWLGVTASSPAAAAVFAAGVLAVGQSTAFFPAGRVLIDLAAPPFMEITTPATGTGGFAASVKILSQVCLMRVAGVFSA